MIIKPPFAEDIPALRRLWQQAFGDSDAFLDSFFGTAFSPDRSLCVVCRGQLAAAGYWFDCDWQGQPVAYIYALATDEAFRGRRVGVTLMKEIHTRLKSLGYKGVALVPGNAGLFFYYEKLGYRGFSPARTVTVTPLDMGLTVQPASKDAYYLLRNARMHENGVLHSRNTFSFLETFCSFHTAGNAIFCLSREGNTLYFQEYLGDTALLPGITAALGGETAVVSVPGEKPSAMYLPLGSSDELPTYFGIPMN